MKDFTTIAAVQGRQFEPYGAAAPRTVDQRRGFILPLTLWIIALMGLGVAAVNVWVTAAADNARALQSKVNEEITMANLKNELVFEMGTRATGFRGLEVGENLVDDESDKPDLADFMAAPKETAKYIAFDGRPYVLESSPDYVVQLYDARGLLNLNIVSVPILQRFLNFFDVPETARNQLPDTLADWIDTDDLTRLAGAEKTDYQRMGKHPPTNASLMTPLEVQSVMGWDQYPALWEADMNIPLFTTCPSSGFNPNTAPEMTLLAYIAGMTKENTAQVLTERAKAPFRSARDFMAAADVILPNEAFFLTLIPGGCLIVDLTNRETNERIRFSLTLLRIPNGQPWQVDYAFHIPTQYRRKIDGVDPQVVFPTPETISAGDQGNNGTPGVR